MIFSFCAIQLLYMANVVVFDLQITAVRPGRDEIIEVAAHIVDAKGMVLRTFHELCNPGLALGKTASGITDDMLCDKEPFACVMRRFWEFVGPMTLIAHNVDFLKRFLLAENKRKNSMYCSLLLSKQLLRNQGSFDLRFLWQSMSLDVPIVARHHHALQNTLLIVRLLLRIGFFNDTRPLLSLPRKRARNK